MVRYVYIQLGTRLYFSETFTKNSAPALIHCDGA